MPTKRRWLVEEVSTNDDGTWVRIVPAGSYGPAEDPPKVGEMLKPAGPAPPMPEYSDRGFAYWDPTMTSYGAEVKIAESSSAEGPHLWLHIDQPAPKRVGELPQVNASAHMSLDQAEEIRSKLDAAIRHAKDVRGWV